jgi:hypothetical protein
LDHTRDQLAALPHDRALLKQKHLKSMGYGEGGDANVDLARRNCRDYVDEMSSRCRADVEPM